MPIYEYQCRGCDEDFEKYLPAPSTAVACPACGSDGVTRKLSVFGLKSSGEFASSMAPQGGGCCGGGCSCH